MSQVRIFGATPGTAAVTWQQVADLSAELKAQLVASKWQVSRAHRQPLQPLQLGMSVRAAYACPAAALQLMPGSS
jgi:hypothetical protein